MTSLTRKKILVISYLFPNANQPNHGIFVLNRLKAMSKYADITVINPIPDSPVHHKISKFASIQSVPLSDNMHGIQVYHPRFFSIPGYLKSVEVLSYYRAVSRVISAEKLSFDLIDLHWTFPDLPTGAWLSNKFNVPFHVTLRGMEAFHLQDSGLRKNIVAHFLKKANNVISLSQEMAEQSQLLANTAERTTVIRNGVDTDKFHFIIQSECRETLQIAQHEKIILGVGSLIYRKGFDLVIKALAHLIKEPDLADIKFYILGSQGPEGDYRKELAQLIKQYNLVEQVVFVGAVDNASLVTWYNAVDVFCLSSRGEGSPNVLTEALACGTPAVATNVGSVPEIMASEENLGFCVDNEDLASLTERLKDALLTTTDRENNAQNFNQYNWDWCAQSVMKVIQSTLKAQQRG